MTTTTTTTKPVIKTLNDFLSEYTNYTYEEIEDNFASMLDECSEPVELAGMTIYASDMKTIDPTMFRCGVADYSSEEYTEHANMYYCSVDMQHAEAAYEEYELELEENEDD
jgi:hypothetical protein